MRHGRRQHRVATARAIGFQGVGKVRAIGEQGCGVTVIAHAQHQHVNQRAARPASGQPARQLVPGWRWRCTDSGTAPWPPGLAADAVFSRPALLSACSTGTHRSSARVIVTLDQSRPAWPSAGKRPPGCGHRTPPGLRRHWVLMAVRNCFATSIGQAVGQLHWRAVLMGSYALRQFQFRYRHTTTSHPA